MDARFNPNARAGQLDTRIPVDRLEELLDQQETRWWRIKIQSFEDNGHSSTRGAICGYLLAMQDRCVGDLFS